jgi:uncharacterized protein (TIGR02611 family)
MKSEDARFFEIPCSDHGRNHPQINKRPFSKASSVAETIRQARRLIVSVVGVTLVLCGVVMLITPGPGLLLIFAGLSMLALEFVWARRLLRKIKMKGNELERTLIDRRKK